MSRPQTKRPASGEIDLSATKRPALGPEPDKPPRHIDLIHHLSQVLLCCNRVFQERGISRAIAGFYKDLLYDDVLVDAHRLCAKASMNEVSISDGEIRQALPFLLQYVTYYPRCRQIYECGLRYCSRWTNDLYRLYADRSAIYLETFVKAAECHPDHRLRAILFNFLQSLFVFDARAPRSFVLIERFLDMGGGAFILRDWSTLEGFESNEWAMSYFIADCSRILSYIRRVIVERRLDRHWPLLARLDEALEQAASDQRRLALHA